MKKVLKLIFSLTLLLVVAVAFTACNNDDDSNGGAATGQSNEVRIALIAHSPDSILDDGSFNQGAWAGIQRYLSSHGLNASEHSMFFQPDAADDVARIDLVNDAVEWGADILVMPGFHFIASLYDAQDLFPDTHFVLLDATPAGASGPRIERNVAAIHYAEEEAGFLAGYAIVMEGHRNLGFMGGIAVPAVVRFGHGFIQGAEHAAASLGLPAGEVTIDYMYLGGFAPDPVHQTTAASWFATGTEVIFAAAGGAGNSVIAAAEAAGALVIGVDVDQAHLSNVVISSAMKALDNSVYDMISDFVAGNFRGGNELMFNASVDGIGLPMGTSRFANFTQAQYNAIFGQLASGAINVNASLEMSAIMPSISLVTVNEM